MQDISSILGAAGKSGTDIFSEPNSSPIVSESNNAEKFSNIFNEISETYNQSESQKLILREVLSRENLEPLGILRRSWKSMSLILKNMWQVISGHS